MPEVTIPYNFTPRQYQLPLWRYFEGEQPAKRACLVWHRRAGKDLCCLNILVKEAVLRKGNYWFILPYYSQVRKAIWEGKTSNGMAYLDCVPKDLIAKKNESDMSITLKTGSIIRFLGGDKPDSLVGAGPCGIVFSEWALCKPSLWDFLEPILTENNGWAIFNSTPRGDNHLRTTFEKFKKDKSAFASILTVDDTGIVSQKEIEKKRKVDLIPEEIIQQEYFCSFAGARTGSYYGAELNSLSLNGGFKDNLFDTTASVHTYWDLGLSDETAIWFVQYVNDKIYVIDYYENHNLRLSDYADVLIREKRYRYGSHNLPHDGARRDLSSAVPYRSLLLEAGLQNINVIPRCRNVLDGIMKTRQILSRCVFNEVKCKDGLYCLRNYHREYDNDRKCFRERPEHDNTSHGADAFRMIAESNMANFKPYKEVVVNNKYDFLEV